jgi:hypothetical protein
MQNAEMPRGADMNSQKWDGTLTAQQVGPDGCGEGTPEECFALYGETGAFQCLVEVNPELAVQAAVSLAGRVNIDPVTSEVRCPAPDGIAEIAVAISSQGELEASRVRDVAQKNSRKSSDRTRGRENWKLQ